MDETRPHGFRIGDQVTFDLPRHWTEIWRDRIRNIRWDVPTKKIVTVRVTETTSSS
jgi:hypothetical protein